MNLVKVKNFFLMTLFCSIGCITCLYLVAYQGLPNYLASALVGLVGSFLPRASFYDSKEATACVYAGSFAGMCSVSFFSNTTSVLALCFLVGVSFRFINPYFKGVGGKLGTIGFVSSLLYLGLRSIL